MQESVGKVYDTTTGALGSAGETFSNSVGSAKDTVFGVAQKQQEEPEGGVYDRAAQYYDIATQKTAEAAQAMKAAAAQTAQHVQGNAYQAADTSRNTLHDTGSTIYDSLAMAGEKLSQAAEAARDSTLKVKTSVMKELQRSEGLENLSEITEPIFSFESCNQKIERMCCGFPFTERVVFCTLSSCILDKHLSEHFDSLPSAVLITIFFILVVLGLL
jgi:hypothetical protein